MATQQADGFWPLPPYVQGTAERHGLVLPDIRDRRAEHLHAVQLGMVSPPGALPRVFMIADREELELAKQAEAAVTQTKEEVLS